MTTLRFKKLKVSYKRYEGILIPLALVSGFLTDILTFRMISFTLSMIFLFCHILFAGTNIGIINYYKGRQPEGKFFSYWKLFAPLFLQFSFGNLFSGFLIFYSESGSFFASWPFIAVLTFLLIGNEISRRLDLGPVVQIGVYFFALFSYFNLALPYIFRNLSVFMFLFSGFFSLLFLFGFIKLISIKIPEIRLEKKNLKITVGSVFILMNFLYFTNLIPPIPLSIKDVGVYHSVERVNDNYLVVGEDCQKLDWCFFTGEEVHISSIPQRIYFYSAVYSPPRMDMMVIHHWEIYDPDSERWLTEAEIPYEITGGREIGFRWYSYYTGYPGTWRVSIKTERGQVIGRKKFKIIYGESEREILEI